MRCDEALKLPQVLEVAPLAALHVFHLSPPRTAIIVSRFEPHPDDEGGDSAWGNMRDCHGYFQIPS